MRASFRRGRLPENRDGDVVGDGRVESMTMTAGLRKFALTAHVTCSVGWAGAVASFLALGIAGLISQDAQIVRAAYLAMDLTGWFIIVPLTFASLLTGLVQALGTSWGLFRHYWVLMKLLITLLSTLLLLVHMQPTSRLAGAAVEALSSPDLRQMRIQLVADASLALLALLVATTLAVYKPRGMTRYGTRREREQVDAGKPGVGSAARMPRWVKILGVIGIVVLFAGMMFGPHGLGRHIQSGDAGYTSPAASQNASLNRRLHYDGCEKSRPAPNFPFPRSRITFRRATCAGAARVPTDAPALRRRRALVEGVRRSGA